MGILGDVQGNINSATNKIRNPFSAPLSSYGPDFPEGLIIQEILSNGSLGEKVVLAGNMLPKEKFPFGGSIRMKKEFYSGLAEPSVQVFGPEEDDINIKGEFKDKRYKQETFGNVTGISFEISKMIDAIRRRGNIVKITLGEITRYGLINNSKFELFSEKRVMYDISFSIIGDRYPRNAIFVQDNKEYPNAYLKNLVELASNFQKENDNIPDSVPLSIADQIKSLTSDVASAIKTVTTFADSIVSTVEDIRSSIERINGLIKYTQNKINSYKKFIGGLQPFSLNNLLSKKYESSKYYSGAMARCAPMVSMMERLRAQFSSIASNLPLARHLVKTGDTLQKISIKFYKNPDGWKRIYDYNNLSSTDLIVGRLLNIPRE